jgi:hypothetical protein
MTKPKPDIHFTMRVIMTLAADLAAARESLHAIETKIAALAKEHHVRMVVGPN